MQSCLDTDYRISGNVKYALMQITTYLEFFAYGVK